ncbi:MAG: helix-turn-helix domain-containing protein [Trebonia sp.]
MGRVALEADGLAVQDARLPGRQGRLLFAYLAVERGRPVPRDKLAAALWGEAPPATWDKALTVLVSKLRSLLTEAGLDGPHALTAALRQPSALLVGEVRRGEASSCTASLDGSGPTTPRRRPWA